MASDRIDAVATATVVLTDEQIANEIIDVLGANRATPRTAEPKHAAASQDSLSPSIHLLQIQSTKLGAERWARINEIMGSSPNPAELVQHWHDIGANTEVLRQAAACLIPRVESLQWADWLVADAMVRRRFVEAWAVSIASAVETSVPPSALMLISALDSLEVGRAADDAVVDLLDRDLGGDDPIRVAAACGCIWDTLRRPFGADLAWLAHLAEGSPRCLSQLVKSTEEYVRRTGVGVPFEHLETIRDHDATSQALEGQWQAINADVEKMRQSTSRWRGFTAGGHLHRLLFDSDGLLDLIARASATPGRQRTQLARELPKNVRRHLDDIIQGAGILAIDWGRQTPFLDRLESLVRRSRKASLRQATPTSIDSGLRESLRTLADAIAPPIEALAVEASAYPQPLGAVVNELGTLLSPLLDWRSADG